MSQDNRQYHFRPANYPYRPTAEDLDSRNGSAEQPPPENSDTPQDADSMTPESPAVTRYPAPVAPVKPEPGFADTFSPEYRPPNGPRPEPAAPPTERSGTRVSETSHQPVTGPSGPPAPVAAFESPPRQTPTEPVSPTAAAPASHPQHGPSNGSSGADSGGPAAPVPTPGGSEHSDGGHGGHLLPRLLSGLLVVLALLVGLAIGSFALNNPTVRTTPGPTNTVTATATVTPPAQTVTPPPATVTVTPTSGPTTVTATATQPVTGQATSTQGAATAGTVVVGQSCSSFGEVAYAADGTRLTCTRPTVQDYLRWMQVS